MRSRGAHSLSWAMCASLVVSGCHTSPPSVRSSFATPSARSIDTAVVALEDSVRRILEGGVAAHAFPGGVAVIGRSSGPLVTVAAGHLDWAASPTPDARTLWDLASLTKVVGLTSAVMTLVQSGALALDAPVQRYLPEWRGQWKERVTLRHLLTHQSGLPPFELFYRQSSDPVEVLRLVMATPLDTMPGVRMVYSDIGAIVLTQVVARVSGMSLDALLRERVFAPLAMGETMYRPSASLRTRIAPTEIDPWRGRQLQGEVHDENAFALGGVSGHAGLFSTAADLTRFAQMYLQGGVLDGHLIFSSDMVAMFTAVQDSAFSNRALGWETPTGNNSAGSLMRRPAFGHTGFTGTSLWIDPAHNLFVLVLTNRVNPTRAQNGIAGVRRAIADAAMSYVLRAP